MVVAGGPKRLGPALCTHIHHTLTLSLASSRQERRVVVLKDTVYYKGLQTMIDHLLLHVAVQTISLSVCSDGWFNL